MTPQQDVLFDFLFKLRDRRVGQDGQSQFQSENPLSFQRFISLLDTKYVSNRNSLPLFQNAGGQ